MEKTNYEALGIHKEDSNYDLYKAILYHRDLRDFPIIYNEDYTLLVIIDGIEYLATTNIALAAIIYDPLNNSILDLEPKSESENYRPVAYTTDFVDYVNIGMDIHYTEMNVKNNTEVNEYITIPLLRNHTDKKYTVYYNVETIINHLV